MTNIFLSIGVVLVIYIIFKFLEMKYIDKESKPLKVIVKDTFIVYLSILFGNFIFDQLKPMINSTDITNNVPLVFTDNPPF